VTVAPTIRRAVPSDAAAVAAIHCRRIPWGLLTQMGEVVVAAFYAALIDSPWGFAFVAEQGSGLVGFASGVVDWRRFYRQFLCRHPGLAAAAVLQSLRAGRWWRLLETSRYAVAADLPRAELVSVALEPETRGAGVAAALVRRVLEEFAARGVPAVRVTAGASNTPATRLYERAGFRLHRQLEMHPGVQAAVYVLSLADRAVGARP
jgi:ribosomal protein S18 acetylase RimI-like enzyme